MKLALVTLFGVSMCAIGAAQDPVALPQSPYLYTVCGLGGTGSIEISDQTKPAYFELQAKNEGYDYGSVTVLCPRSTTITSVEVRSVEEDPASASWAIYSWWTEAPASPEYSGGGSLYYYQAGVGSAWSQPWVDMGTQWGFTPGPVASIDPNYYQGLSDANKATLQVVLGTTDEAVLSSYGAIRFYLSSMAGPGTSPLRIGALVSGAAGSRPSSSRSSGTRIRPTTGVPWGSKPATTVR